MGANAKHFLTFCVEKHLKNIKIYVLLLVKFECDPSENRGRIIIVDKPNEHNLPTYPVPRHPVT